MRSKGLALASDVTLNLWNSFHSFQAPSISSAGEEGNPDSVSSICLTQAALQLGTWGGWPPGIQRFSSPPQSLLPTEGRHRDSS